MRGLIDKRKKQLGNSIIVNCEIPPNRYSFFKALRDKMLSDSRFELNIELKVTTTLYGGGVMMFVE